MNCGTYVQTITGDTLRMNECWETPAAVLSHGDLFRGICDIFTP